MPTYEYLCEACGVKFDRRQSMKDAPLTECPECSGKVRRLLSGGGGIILKSSEPCEPYGPTADAPSCPMGSGYQ